MRFPLTISLGNSELPLHTLFETAAFIIGFRYFLYLRKRHGDTIEQSGRVWIIIGAIFGALIGSRLVGGLENINSLRQSSNWLLYVYQNKTVAGGFLGGLFGVELVKWCIGERKPSGDLFAYPMILALIIGRAGCFTMGVYEETYGIPSSLPWAMNLGDGILRHPVTLYEILFLVLLWAALVITEKKVSLAPGARFKIFMIAYLLFRLLLDWIKPRYSTFAGLSAIQISCLVGLLWYSRYILHPVRLLNKPAIISR